MAANRVIGRDNQIPWHIPGEQRRFRETTWGHSLIMGRKTHESIGRALPGRRNIVITRNQDYTSPGCEIIHSLDEICCAAGSEDDRVFIIGGEQLFCQALDRADTLILTILPDSFPGDAYFPEFSRQIFQLNHVEEISQPVPYTINIYTKQ